MPNYDATIRFRFTAIDDEAAAERLQQARDEFLIDEDLVRCEALVRCDELTFDDVEDDDHP